MDEKNRTNFTGEPVNPIPVGEVFPEAAAQELNNGRGTPLEEMEAENGE